MSDHHEALTVVSGRNAGSLTMTVTGEVDSANCTQVQDELERLAADGRETSCAVDLAGVSFMDSSGLRALLLGQRAMTDAGKTMMIVGVSDNVHRLFEITGLLERFGVPS
jgi:anti-anti-sigma factor